MNKDSNNNSLKETEVDLFGNIIEQKQEENEDECIIDTDSVYEELEKETIPKEKEEKPKKNKPKKSRSNIVRTVLLRAILVILTIAIIAVIGVFNVLKIVILGPSETAKEKLVMSTLEMSAAKFVPTLFLSFDEISAIVEDNKVQEVTDVTDPTLIVIGDDKNSNIQSGKDDNVIEDEWANYPDGIRIDTITGGTYRAHVMVVKDPARLSVATSSDFKSGAPGAKIQNILKRENAVAGINGGGFPDPAGEGAGDTPNGLVISNGELLWGGLDKKYTAVMGFTKENILVVGNMTGREALDKGVRDCVSFGPILIVNGEAAQIKSGTGSLNPRTAIGQRADGGVILVCVDGRMASSLGASYEDLIDIMQQYGAINAANLDGGSSTFMYYKGEPVNVSSSLYGIRNMPTFFVVK